MTAPSSPDWDQLGRYLAGESSPDESATVRRWLGEHPADAEIVVALEAALKHVAPERPVNVEAALRRVKTRAKAGTRKVVLRFAALAAAAALLFVAGTFLSRRWDLVNRPTPEVAYSTGTGQRSPVVLEDGSRVLIGPASRLVVRGREVELIGEAFFTVVHDSRRPFTVRAGDAIIRDIGTEFSVHSDRNEPVRVVVREGAVELKHATDSVTLNPGDVGVVEQSGRVEANRGAAIPDDLAWTTGRLVFRNTPVTELAEDLRRWYGVQLRVTDSTLLRRHFTGSFAGEPVNRVLDVIALALGARIERRGDTAFVRVAAPGR